MGPKQTVRLVGLKKPISICRCFTSVVGLLIINIDASEAVFFCFEFQFEFDLLGTGHLFFYNFSIYHNFF